MRVVGGAQQREKIYGIRERLRRVKNKDDGLISKTIGNTTRGRTICLSHLKKEKLKASSSNCLEFVKSKSKGGEKKNWKVKKFLLLENLKESTN